MPPLRSHQQLLLFIIAILQGCPLLPLRKQHTLENGTISCKGGHVFFAAMTEFKGQSAPSQSLPLDVLAEAEAKYCFFF